MNHPMSPLLALALPLALAACVEYLPPPDPLPPEPIENACGALGLQGLVGQNARVLRTMKFGVPTRIVEPGMAVTMDFNPNRLNIWIAEGNVIERVDCG